LNFLDNLLGHETNESGAGARVYEKERKSWFPAVAATTKRATTVLRNFLNALLGWQ
jgi:hypothetical protein